MNKFNEDECKELTALWIDAGRPTMAFKAWCHNDGNRMCYATLDARRRIISDCLGFTPEPCCEEGEEALAEWQEDAKNWIWSLEECHPNWNHVMSEKACELSAELAYQKKYGDNWRLIFRDVEESDDILCYARSFGEDKSTHFCLDSTFKSPAHAALSLMAKLKSS